MKHVLEVTVLLVILVVLLLQGSDPGIATSQEFDF